MEQTDVMPKVIKAEAVSEFLGRVNLRKWDNRFLEMAYLVGSWSKDPSTKVGAVIVRPEGTVVSVGFNGFPKGIKDTDERLNNKSWKYAVVIHSEENALAFANGSCRECTVYTHPIIPCPRCAAKLIQAGVKRVVSLKNGRLCAAGMELDLSRQLFREAGVKLDEI